MIGSVIWDGIFYRFAIYEINKIRWRDAFAVAFTVWRRRENRVTEKSFLKFLTHLELFVCSECSAFLSVLWMKYDYVYGLQEQVFTT